MKSNEKIRTIEMVENELRQCQLDLIECEASLEQIIANLADAGLTVWRELTAEYVNKSRAVDWGALAMVLLEQAKEKYG